tara:strand:- start:336 stop:1316 length:981 start_codon:yes stop_codon:yes gene_type:complete
MNILLTGGAGYIGSNVVLALLDSGHKVHVIDNLSTGNESLIPKNVKFSICDIEDTVAVSNIIKNDNFDAIMHFAGYIQVEESVNNPEKYFTNNTKNSISLFETCRDFGLKNIIFSSTASAYGISTNASVNEGDQLNPQNPYAESKVQAENFLINNQTDFNFIILRYFNVAGADYNLRSGQISNKSTHLIKILSEVIIKKRKNINIFGNDYNTHDGTAIRDYIHVSDLADIHLKTAEYLIKNQKSNIFNCGYGKGFSVLDVINTANNIYKDTVKFNFSSRRKGDVEKLIANVNKITKFIKWKPKFDDLEVIIRSSVEWEKKLSEKNL